MTTHIDWRPFDKDPNINLYWEIKYGTERKYLSNSKLEVFFNVHIFNILDNHYRYTCHGGWIDKAHFDTRSPKRNPTIGAEGLWRRIKDEVGESAPRILRADHWSVVTYRQDMGFSKLYKYVERVYLIRKGLSNEVKKRVCMTIFQEVSYEFEASQALGAPESSFEVSDLVSNMLGLYTVIEGYNPSEVLKELKEVDARTSVKIYLKDLQTFTHVKNRVFYPQFLGKDECPHTPKCSPELTDKFQKIKLFPKVLNKIKPHQAKFATDSKGILLDITLPDSKGVDL